MFNLIKQPPFSNGFALLSSLLLLSLLTLLALSTLTLVQSTTRRSQQEIALLEARSNAQMALILALGALQKELGPDQRISANASILEQHFPTPCKNPHWLGAWDNTHLYNRTPYPIIGKKPDSGINSPSPYSYQAIYNDLRSSLPDYQDGQWRTKLHRSWLVSKTQLLTTPQTDLIPLLHADQTHYERPASVRIVGRGTLHKDLSTQDFNKHSVLIEKIPLLTNGKTTGKVGWWITDNNQKSLIRALHPNEPNPSLISTYDQPAALSLLSNPLLKPFQDITKGSSSPLSLPSYSSLSFLGSSSHTLKQALGEHFHSFTHNAHGLFIDVTLGAFKKDLTPLLFGKKETPSILFPPPENHTAFSPFSSADPIIPGHRHALIGPSFDALRNWGLLKYQINSTQEPFPSSLVFPKNSLRPRPVGKWGSPPATGDLIQSRSWASLHPKIYPVMTDARWHYYFSYRKTNGHHSPRTHFIPRVCLWNPYHTDLSMPDLLVIMDNPFSQRGRFHFHLPPSYINELKSLPKFQSISPQHPLKKWSTRYPYFLIQSNYKQKKPGLFPLDSHLVFVLKSTLFKPGECLVFSPEITTPHEEVDGVRVQYYQPQNISSHLLSSKVPQGRDHFIFDCPSLKIQVKNNNNNWISSSYEDEYLELFKAIDFSKVIHYGSWSYFHHPNFSFSLKVPNATIQTTAQKIISSPSSYPTLQWMNYANAGESSYHFWHYASWWGTSQESSKNTFGNLSTFQQNPHKDAPATHQFGTKLLWLDERFSEANKPPLRHSKWAPDHVAFHPASIANWNIRPHYISRSPASICASSWYTNTAGAWFLQFSPFSPKDPRDQPSFIDGQFRKHPFGYSERFQPVLAPLIDLPDHDYGALSLGALRHAHLSPFSWTPTYIIGHSRASPHAPLERTAHPLLENPSSHLAHLSLWDKSIGAQSPYPLDYGLQSTDLSSDSIFQTGSHAIAFQIGQDHYSSANEILAYDIAYETNQNLWDHFFISGVSIHPQTSLFSYQPHSPSSLQNPRYTWNPFCLLNKNEYAQQLNQPSGLSLGFWNNAYAFCNRAAFNVNSTSLSAWVSILSGGRQLSPLPIQKSPRSPSFHTTFPRIHPPLNVSSGNSIKPTIQEGWSGARSLSDQEIHLLAQHIIRHIKQYGPFLSLADFINRRLAPKDESSAWKGVLEAALDSSQINHPFEHSTIDQTRSNGLHDANHPQWKVDYKLSHQHLRSKAWGASSYLTQQDLLSALSPALSVRGDSFTIRAVGESRSKRGVLYRAYLEATVIRTPGYIYSTHPQNKNQAVEPFLILNRSTGSIALNPALSSENKMFGRRFKIISLRWLQEEEI